MPENMLITGPTNGIGRETALTLGKLGHKLFLLCRNREAGEALADEIAALPGAVKPVVIQADLGDMDQVRAAAEHFKSLGEPLHVLINNAGVVNTSRKAVPVNGKPFEQMFAVNYLGPYLLTRLLLPVLEETARERGKASKIVVVASDAHAIFCKGMDFDDLNHEKEFSTFKVYGRSKLGNLLMVHELVKRVNKEEVLVNSLHPGAVNSKLGDNNKHWYAPIIKLLTKPFFISPEKGADTSIYLATTDVPTQGAYYVKRKVKPAKPWASDDQAASRLWQYSEELLGL